MWWTYWAQHAPVYQRSRLSSLASWPQTETRARENARMAILDRAFPLVRGCGQGQDRTADLPLFRRSVAFSPPSRKWIISPAHPHFRWRGCQVLRHGHRTTSAAVCRGMPFCPCYSRVDLRPSPGLVLLLCWRENHGQPGTSALAQRPPQGTRRAPPGTRRTGHAACRQGRASPGRMTVPCRNAAHAPADPSAPDRANAFEAPPCVPGAALHHHSAPARRPSADRTTHSNEKRLLSISEPRRTPTRSGSVVDWS